MKISFCTTCMGRLHHLKSTLIQNLHDNLQGDGSIGHPHVEFIVLDYSSRDGLQDWVSSDPETRAAIQEGRLIYARHPDAPHFRMSHAKNMAHRLAIGDVVCNVDADNFTGLGFAAWLSATMAENPDAAIVYPHYGFIKTVSIDDAGFVGRIAMTKHNFMKLGGYDEQFSCWGGDDNNMIARAYSLGLRAKPITNRAFLRIIPHDHMERVKNMASKKDAEQIAQANKINLKTLTSHFRDAAGWVQANNGYFGVGRVLVGLSALPQNLGPAYHEKIWRPACIGTPALLKTWLTARPQFMHP